MVDPIGAKPASSLDRRVAPVAPSAAGTPVAPVADGGESAQRAASVAEAARNAAQAAPIDRERVEALRTAIAKGEYRPSAQTIADRLIGHMQEWTAR